jgi:hypothetical protein
VGRIRPLLVLALLACSAPPDQRAAIPQAPEIDWRAVACRLPRSQLERTIAGYRPGRSGDVQFVPRPPNYFGEHSHSGPWAYLQRVPLLLYGPGHVPVGRIHTPVTLNRMAPTIGRLLGTPMPGRPFPGAPRPAEEAPLVVVVLVWDGAGRNVLRAHPQGWPVLERLRRHGLWYERAAVGTSPSVSPAVHASLSTGLPPSEHGLVDMVFRQRGRIVEIQEDPRYLRALTLADRHDRRLGNRPVVALVGHPLIVGMLGRGAAIPGGDRDVALIESKEGWTPPLGGAELFRFPRWARESAMLADELEAGDDDEEVDPSATPAWADFQTATIRRLVRREEVGEDRVPDLLLVNYNQVNEAGHHWSMHGAHVRDALRSSDRALGRLVQLLNRQVGPGRWAIAVTADHGSTPDDSVSGGFQIDEGELSADLRRALDGDGDGATAIRAIRVTQLWLDREELAQDGLTEADPAWFLLRYTQGDNRSGLPEDERDVAVFAAAFPSSVLERPLRCG